jgi:DNA-binding transcriptional LysR family regulator
LLIQNQEYPMTFDGRLLAGVSVLAAVIESGSFVKAADSLGITASGVSRAIGRLETRIGIRLFDRTTRSLTLTEEGRGFFETVGPLLSGIEEAAAKAAGSTVNVRGRLRVDIDPFFLRFALGGKLSTFNRLYPDISLDVVSREHLGDLVADGIDLAIRFGAPTGASLVARKLIEAPILTVASPIYLKRRGAPDHPRDLSDHTCLHFRNPRTGVAFEWDLVSPTETVTLTDRGALCVGDVHSLLDECLAGGGVAQVIAWGVADLIEEGKLVDLFPDWHGETFPLFALHPSRAHTPAKVRAFIDFCTVAIPPGWHEWTKRDR